MAKKECGKNIKKAGNAGIARDCKKKQKRILKVFLAMNMTKIFLLIKILLKNF